MVFPRNIRISQWSGGKKQAPDSPMPAADNRCSDGGVSHAKFAALHKTRIQKLRQLRALPPSLRSKKLAAEEFVLGARGFFFRKNAAASAIILALQGRLGLDFPLGLLRKRSGKLGLFPILGALPDALHANYKFKSSRRHWRQRLVSRVGRLRPADGRRRSSQNHRPRKPPAL